MYEYGSGYSTPDYNTVSSIAGGIAAAGAIIAILSLILGIFSIITMWKIYTKAGKPGWASIVPIYNIIVLLEITGLPTWYIALFFVPFANIYAMFKIYIELAHKFGKSTGFGVAMIFFSIICLPILAFSKNCVYNGNINNTQMNNNMQNPQPQMNNGMMNQNNFMDNNMTNNNVQGPMFNQNINTDINQIQPEINNGINNNMQDANQILPQQENNMNSNNISNVIPNNGSIGSVNPVNQNPQPEQIQNQVENTFKYEEPQTVIPTPMQNVSEIQNTIPNQNIIEPTMNTIPTPIQTIPETPNIVPNINPMEPVQEPQISVIPTIGETPQPTTEQQNPNIINNQNNTNMQ